MQILANIIGVYLSNARQQCICIERKEKDMNIFARNLDGHVMTIMNYLSNKKEMPELLDLPDEMILAIFNEVKPEMLLLSSMIDIGNNRLEHLALTKCHSLDLTFNHYRPLDGSPIQRFYLFILPNISNHIRSLSLNLRHLLHVDTTVRHYIDEMIFSLTHLKIILCRYHHGTEKCFEIGSYYNTPMRHMPLFSIVPEFVDIGDEFFSRVVSILNCSPIMRTIVSLNLDENCVFRTFPMEEGLDFSQYVHLTDLHIGLHRFEDFVRLLNQIGKQLQSLFVTIGHVSNLELSPIPDITSIFCPNLKQFSIKCYRNIVHYDLLISLFPRFSMVEHLTLLLSVGTSISDLDHFIDGSDLERNVICHMSHLRQFQFHIRSILKNAPLIDIDTLRQSFVKQSVDCTLDYFNSGYGQCQVFTLPFVDTRLDFISNRFPLFDERNTFSNVTILLLFDDITPFEHHFFQRLAQALPRLKTLDIFNQLEQEETNKLTTTEKLIEFPHLRALILHNIHFDYVEQLLYRSYLPNLTELFIRNDAFLLLLDKNDQQARNNCANVEKLRIVEPWIQPTIDQLNFFLLIYSRQLENNTE